MTKRTTVTARPSRHAALVAALILAAPAGAAAQHHPAPVPADDPRAQRAGAVVRLVLSGDTAAVTAHPEEHGDPAWVGSGRAAQELVPLRELLAGRDYRIEGYLAGPERSVLVVLMDAERAYVLIQVDMTPSPPFRVTGLTRARLGGGSP